MASKNPAVFGNGGVSSVLFLNSRHRTYEVSGKFAVGCSIPRTRCSALCLPRGFSPSGTVMLVLDTSIQVAKEAFFNLDSSVRHWNDNLFLFAHSS